MNNYELDFVIDHEMQMRVFCTTVEQKEIIVNLWKFHAWNNGHSLKVYETFHAHPIGGDRLCECKKGECGMVLIEEVEKG